MKVDTDFNRPIITYAEMELFLTIAWGDLGKRVAECWADYNKTYFNNKLEPLPIIIVNVSPYGNWLGCTTCNQSTRRAHLIQLTMPTKANALISDKGVLLHEMLHQNLTESGENPNHKGQPWCNGIMDLHQQITGKNIWSAPSQVGKKTDPVTGKRKSYRFNKPNPDTGQKSLTDGQIATWPASVGLKLGSF